MNRRVLIVEDELIVADDLEWRLTQIGCEVIGIVSSGEEAVLLASRQRPETVLMDIQLGGRMSGVEAARVIQRNTGATIIFVTAFAAVFCRDPNLTDPPGIYVGKPFSTVQLKAALQSAVHVEGGHT